MAWFDSLDVAVGEAPCTRGFLLLGWGGASSAVGLMRSLGLLGESTCEAMATKLTVSEQRSSAGAEP